MSVSSHLILRLEWRQLEAALDELLKRFMLNNLKSGNFGVLLQIFLQKQRELQDSVMTDGSLFIWQTFNALVILRVIIKYFVERLKEDEVLRQFEFRAPGSTSSTDTTSSEQVIDQMVHALVDIISNVEQR